MPKGEAGLFVSYCAKDFLDGTQMLDPWEELAYRRICDMIYATNDRLPDDDKKMAWATKTGRRWPAIKAALTTGDKPKLLIEDGRITNARCQFALATAAKNLAQKKGAAEASVAAGKSLKNLKQNRTGVRAPARQDTGNDTSISYDDKTVQKKCAITEGTPAQELFGNLLENNNQVRAGAREPVRTALRTNQESISKEERKTPPNGGVSRARETAELMLGIWREECGDLFGSPSKASDSRIKKCSARLRDDLDGNVENWRALCKRIRVSPYFVEKWQPSIDWVLEPSNMLKIQEGNFDERYKNGGIRKQSAHDAETAAFERVSRGGF